jgi:membrane associated rhomboid family serine protease
MDWSLVLVSQGIESIIRYSPDAGWQLEVSGNDYETALEVISHYRAENQRWLWQREYFKPGLLFDWGSLAWVVLIIFFYGLSAYGMDLDHFGRMDSVALVKGQWWRLFTAVWLHADLAHLAGNATFGLVLLGLALARYGTGVGLLASYLAGAGGNLASALFTTQPHYSLGASGMVMGSLGLLAIQSIYIWRRTPQSSQYIVARLVGGLMLFLLLGLAPGTDTLAHLGGFLGGILLGALASLRPNLGKRAGINLLAGLLFVALVIYPWWLALRHSALNIQ